MTTQPNNDEDIIEYEELSELNQELPATIIPTYPEHDHEHYPQPNSNSDSTHNSNSNSNSSPNFTNLYDDTINKWKKRGSKMAFIYDIVLNKYRKRLSLFTLLAFILSSLTSLLALGDFAFSECDYPTLALTLRIINAIVTTCAAICTGIIQIKDWNHLVNDCQKYLDSIENFVSTIVSEQTLPIRLRIEPDQFVLQQKDKFQSILNSTPNISHDDYIYALDHYQKSKKRFKNDLIYA